MKNIVKAAAIVLLAVGTSAYNPHAAFIVLFLGALTF